jgi:alkylhydroperoxidase family enzyme
VTGEELGALNDPPNSPLFSAAERAALAYAESITTLSSVPDDLFKNVRQHFTDDEIVELTATITWEICAAKFNHALEIEAQGICAVRPASPGT